MNITFKNKFYLSRHGTAQNNELGIESCKVDTENLYALTQEGREQVENEAKQYKDFDIIYSSPFRRTRETAALFAETSKCDVILDNRLKEFDLGDLDQQPYDMVARVRDEHADTDYVHDNGESWSGVLRRVTEFIGEINEKHDNQSILIVTHGSPAEALVDWAAGIPLRRWEVCIQKGKVFDLNG